MPGLAITSAWGALGSWQDLQPIVLPGVFQRPSAGELLARIPVPGLTSRGQEGLTEPYGWLSASHTIQTIIRPRRRRGLVYQA